MADAALDATLGGTHRLVVFDAVMRTGSFSGAARDLEVSQPAVSRQIAILEARLGTELFQRRSGGVVPTESAQSLHPRIEAVVTELRAAVAAIEDHAATITVAAQPAIADSWFAPRLAELRATVAPTTVRLVIFDRDADLEALDHDVSIRFSRGAPRGVRSTALVAETVTPFASPGCAARHDLGADRDPASLAEDVPLLQLDPAGRGWLTWSEWFDHHGLRWTAPGDDIVQPSYGMVVQQALSGRGVVLGWHTVLGDLVRDGMLVPVGPAVTRPDHGYHLVWSPGGERRPGHGPLRRWLETTVHSLDHDRAG